ncbi:unnamed protein product [Paramecium sonneborni]|uniref:Nucleolar protein 56 n=1 Tax=Paramecium sonneborni TaxID=65129 RepID=A0A8S1KP79_9CILI|nr:unnamed protein product [Paramecium sonneborni]
MSTFYLFEAAAGLALFQCDSIDETNVKSKQIQKQFSEFGQFTEVCHLKAFQPFVSAEIALNNALSIHSGSVTQELVDFLSTNLPPVGKKSNFSIAICDKGLAAGLQQYLNLKSKMNEATAQVFRGIRTHFVEFLRNEDFKERDYIQAQLGLAHQVSRNKVKLDINREDKHVTQAISIIEQLDKDLNTLSMRIKEWYSWHFPELAKIVTDNRIFTRIVDTYGDKKNINDQALQEIEEITTDAELAKQIVEASKISMGQDISEIDLSTLKDLCIRVLNQFEFRDNIQEYLKNKMTNIAPNLTALIGENVAAKLIAHAGSLINLAKYPASTIQILGAEKALFRALKTRGNTPKYGLLYHSTYIGRANGTDKGKISRNLANKCAIASRLDHFLIQPTEKFGIKLKDQMEQRLKFLTAGGELNKNTDIMDEVLTELKGEGLYFESEKQLTKQQKKSKKSKSKKVVEEVLEQPEEQPQEAPKKKRKSSKQQ